MNRPLGVTVAGVLGLLLLVAAWGGGARAQPIVMPPLEVRPPCDSPEAEAAALVAQEFLNAQHSHFYKYALNRVEDIKVLPRPDGDDIYLLEVDLLETDCHILDPTPVANCSVRPKVFTAVEGDCDVVLRKVAGVLTVTAFKCKTEESREDLCLGCPTLLPLNDTAALDFVSSSLSSINEDQLNRTETLFTLLEVGRMSRQVVSGGHVFIAEYAIVEANCTDGDCVPLTHNMAQRGFCTAKGSSLLTEVDCSMFPTVMTFSEANITAGPLPAQPLPAQPLPAQPLPAQPLPAQPPPVGVRPNVLTVNHGLRHHKLTTVHDPELSGLLSAESEESSEVVPVLVAGVPVVVAGVPVPVAAVPVAAVPAAVVPVAVVPVSSATDSADAGAAPVVVVKRQVPDVLAVVPPVHTVPIPLVPLCPGRKKFF